jgi:hypothetical protein
MIQRRSSGSLSDPVRRTSGQVRRVHDGFDFELSTHRVATRRAGAIVGAPRPLRKPGSSGRPGKPRSGWPTSRRATARSVRSEVVHQGAIAQNGLGAHARRMGRQVVQGELRAELSALGQVAAPPERVLQLRHGRARVVAHDAPEARKAEQPGNLLQVDGGPPVAQPSLAMARTAFGPTVT